MPLVGVQTFHSTISVPQRSHKSGSFPNVRLILARYPSFDMTISPNEKANCKAAPMARLTGSRICPLLLTACHP
jgi:hypothetical protein